ncbi:hypothetical protein BU26DRAFT_81535 [Trematosphaeria pertusa]|uniref:Uncharacterized protein n=1 Tax=Trematosphaeria pertusa TaxID=390896 RepID=A0A6A6I4N0_9PLEO|nr:uncharacterized protein BU26DRAFT_81535 [Trematosphaeria pertusa]KAF2244570.1 hypothetical protein BU26DRAFT_81535 [Trematosphaeria pertusa]
MQEAYAEKSGRGAEKPGRGTQQTDAHAHGLRCLAAIRNSAKSTPVFRILESSTNPIDRDMELFLFREIASGRSASEIARELSYGGIYNVCRQFPGAFTYLHAGRPRLTEDKILKHMYWRLAKWPSWPTSWEKRLIRGTSLEEVAWCLHEGTWDEPEWGRAQERRREKWRGPGYTDKRGECCHGRKTKEDFGCSGLSWLCGGDSG